MLNNCTGWLQSSLFILMLGCAEGTSPQHNHLRDGSTLPNVGSSFSDAPDHPDAAKTEGAQLDLGLPDQGADRSPLPAPLPLFMACILAWEWDDPFADCEGESSIYFEAERQENGVLARQVVAMNLGDPGAAAVTVAVIYAIGEEVDLVEEISAEAAESDEIWGPYKISLALLWPETGIWEAVELPVTLPARSDSTISTPEVVLIVDITRDLSYATEDIPTTNLIIESDVETEDFLIGGHIWCPGSTCDGEPCDCYGRDCSCCFISGLDEPPCAAELFGE